MICPHRFVDLLQERGVGLVSGVPCSYLTSLINTTTHHPGVRYVGAANEGDAVAIACGAELGGTSAAVMFQNSGFGNAVSPLTSLTTTFQIPVLVMVTWRGQPGGQVDEPQHELMGQITPGLFNLLGIPWKLLPADEQEVPNLLDEALDCMHSRRAPYGIVIRKGLFTKHRREVSPGTPAPARTTRQTQPVVASEFEADEVLRTVQSFVQEKDAILATTGYTSRALYALDDRPNQFYMVGSMGCVSSLGLGLALVQPRRRVIVLDGDGAFLMRMGAAAVVGHARPKNLIHILLDNGVHDSTGGQATVSRTLDAAGIAHACGYARCVQMQQLEDLASELQRPATELTFVHARTRPRDDRRLPRPQMTPVEVGQRFRQQIQATCPTCV